MVFLGINYRRETTAITNTQSTQQFVFDFFEHNNFRNTVAFSGESEENTVGAYGTLTLGYRNYLYLNLQGRNDWTSTLEEANRSIFYPSASVSFVPTDAFQALQNNKCN